VFAIKTYVPIHTHTQQIFVCYGDRKRERERERERERSPLSALSHSLSLPLSLSGSSSVARKTADKTIKNADKTSKPAGLYSPIAVVSQETYSCQKRPIRVKRDLCQRDIFVSKETYSCQKRPVSKRPISVKETYSCQRDLSVSKRPIRVKETYSCQKRPFSVNSSLPSPFYSVGFTW